MRYLMKQKLFAWGEDFVIKDEAGKDVFFVDGRAFSLGDKLSFQDMQGEELAFISEELFSLGPTYKIFHNGALHATVRRSMLSFGSTRFSVDVRNCGRLEAAGDFSEHSYTIRRGDETVATISRQWFVGHDTYGVEIGDGEDVVLLLATTVVIDMCYNRSTPHA